MTKGELEIFIKGLHSKGWKNEDIVKMFCKMFQDERLSRGEFEALLETLEYGLSDKLKSLSDDELRKAVLK